MGEMKGNWIMMRWRSSLWKLVWPKLLCYMLAFTILTLIHVYALTTEQAAQFATLIKWFRLESGSLPLTFMLGFYVSLVVKRWWEQYIKLPWPDEVASVLNAGVTKEPKDEDGKTTIKNLTIRRTIVRYLILSYVLCLRRLSSRMRKEYPDMERLITTELVRPDEAALIGDELPENLQRHGGSNWWLPLKWSLDIARKSQQEGRIAVGPIYSSLVARISGFRSCLTKVASYGHVTVPLVYTQVVHLAVYFFFVVELVAKQPIGQENENHKIWVNVLFMILRFLFYFGWLNVAETLYNPYGEDDDDFELVDLLKRHIRVCYAIVDDGSACPPLQDEDSQPVLDEKEEEDEEGEGVLMDVVEDMKKIKKTED